MARDLLRILALWRLRIGWLAAGALVALIAALAGLALLALAGRGVADGLRDGALFAGGTAATILLLRPVVALRPVARYLERLVTHEATFRALADTRVWFFGRLAERLPAGIGLRRMGDLLGRLVADVEALDGLYLRALVPAAAGIAVVTGIALVLGATSPVLVAILPLALALLLPPPWRRPPRAGRRAASARAACAPRWSIP